MNTDEYFERVTNKVNNMSDEEFLNLLKESGLDDCPLRDDIKRTYKIRNKATKENFKYNYNSNERANNFRLKVA